MKYYMVIGTNLTSTEWVADYLENVTPLVQSFGGRYLARTPKVEMLEGEGGPPQYALIAEFPSKVAALRFYNSDEYKPYKDARQQGAQSRFFLIAAEGASL